MKILHIAPNAPYNDGWGYQENLLPKYQQRLGHDVTLIVPNLTHQDGKIVKTKLQDYVREDGVRVIRLEQKQYPHRVLTNLRAYLEVYPLLEQLRPDLVFFHGLVSATVFDVIRYKKIAPDCVIVQDNHLDPNIGLGERSLKEKLIRGYHRSVNRRSIKHVERVYGVTPWRKAYAQSYFKIPPEKTDVLIMGADDEKIDLAGREEIRSRIRQAYRILDGEFLVVTGGKIDKKKNIHLLMEACGSLSGVRLLVFGNVEPDIREEFHRQMSDNITHIGWVDADKVYDLFFAADLAVFPGQHSVLWEQACAAKVPCLFAQWEGMEHLDNGGNSDWIKIPTVEAIRQKIGQLQFTPEYHQMKQVARSEATDIYLYGQIAKRSLECAERRNHEHP